MKLLLGFTYGMEVTSLADDVSFCITISHASSLLTSSLV